MSKLSRYIDIYFLLLMTEIFLLITVVILRGKNIGFLDYFLIGVIFLTMIISYISGIIPGLLASGFAVFGYGSYMIYQSMFNNMSMGFEKYVWLILLPLSAFLSGRLSFNIIEIQKRNKELEEEIKNLVTIDEVTGLNNTRGFYLDLNKEMSKAKRRKFDLALMLIKIQYFEEVKSILGEGKFNAVIKAIGNSIEAATRNEDERYKLKEDMFGVIMPNTDEKGAKLVNDRIKEDIDNISFEYGGKEETYKLYVKFGVYQYNEKIQNSFEFKELAEKELEFDV
jgi:diguanylate cyclase (GGDEF)-like protein